MLIPLPKRIERSKGNLILKEGRPLIVEMCPFGNVDKATAGVIRQELKDIFKQYGGCTIEFEWKASLVPAEHVPTQAFILVLN